jgi:hypothetical protein
MFPAEASARGTRANQRQFHPKPSNERAALLLRRLGQTLCSRFTNLSRFIERKIRAEGKLKS